MEERVLFDAVPDGDLRFTSGTWSAGTCTASGGSLECSAATLAANSSNSISIQVTGTTVGTESYSISVSAGEPDTDTSNNQAAGQVSVNEQAVSDDSGGGSTGLLTLFTLLGVARLRASRRSRFS